MLIIPMSINYKRVMQIFCMLDRITNYNLIFSVIHSTNEFKVPLTQVQYNQLTESSSTTLLTGVHYVPDTFQA